jgi:SNF family Na+-dependent transporter
VVYFSKNVAALDTFDFWVGSVAIYILATVEVLLFGWVLGAKKGREELQRGAEIRLPRAVVFVVKYVSPVYLLIVFVLWLKQSAGDYVKAIAGNHVVAMSVGFIVLIFVFFLLLVAQAVRRWQARDMGGMGP